MFNKIVSPTPDAKLRTSRAVTLSEAMSPNFNPEGMKRIISEALILLGGVYAILLQVAMPEIANGVYNHSNFSQRPLQRLKITLNYMYSIVYGTPAEKRNIIASVHKAHSAVKGPGYDADNEHLQLWVAATLYKVGTEIYEKFINKMDEQQSDNVYREYSILATALHVRPELWPSDRNTFSVYWDEMIRSLEVTDHAKSICVDLLYNKSAPTWMRACLPFLRVLTAEWLPSQLRDSYGLKRHPIPYQLFEVVTRLTYPSLPRWIRSSIIRILAQSMDIATSNTSNSLTRRRKRQRKIRGELSISTTEVSEHNRVNDIWIIINGKVFDVTLFQYRHPGGEKVLQHVAGQDASESFKKYHKSSTLENYYELFVGNVLRDSGNEVSR
jgi:uncharacterized protein (DUF2236 family)/predicted heme/steroid binding protein